MFKKPEDFLMYVGLSLFIKLDPNTEESEYDGSQLA